MPNPFYTGAAKPASPQYNLNDIYKMLSTSKNPTQLFQNIAKNNPNMAPIMNLLNNGITPEQVFNYMCKQRGVDPQQFINNITR